MATLKEARAELAALLSTLEYDEGKNFRITPRPRKGNLRRGDGFVTVRSTAPDDFARSFLVVFNAFLLLGSDETLADEDVENLSVPAVNLVINWVGMDVTIEPQSLVGGEAFQGETFALSLTCSVEVTS